MLETIQQIRDLATATDNTYLLHYIDKLEIEIEEEITKQIIKFKNDLLELTELKKQINNKNI